MPLNKDQRLTLKSVLRDAIDALLEDRRITYQQKCTWLRQIISDTHPSLEEAINLMKGSKSIVGINNIPLEIREDWRTICGLLQADNPVISEEILKRVKKIPNYDFSLLASIKKFEIELAGVPEEIKIVLIHLRELYLEMTPMENYTFGEGYPEFRFRIGNVPLNLNTFGNTPIIPGEIQSDVKDYIEERLKIEENHQQDLVNLEQKKEREKAGQVYALNLRLELVCQKIRGLEDALQQSNRIAIPTAQSSSSSSQFNINAVRTRAIVSRICTQTFNDFLKLVVKGEQDKAEKMLQSNVDLALVAGEITDLSGRIFKNITAFQYAVWALDWHMWEMLLKYLPAEAAREQAREFKTGSWVKEYGEHASWQNLLDALKVYFRNYDDWSLEQRKNYWVQTIGRIQSSLPAHVIQEYFQSTRSFYPCPDFSKGPLLRTTQLYDKFLLERSNLGIKFGFWRGDSNSCKLEIYHPAYSEDDAAVVAAYVGTAIVIAPLLLITIFFPPLVRALSSEPLDKIEKWERKRTHISRDADIIALTTLFNTRIRQRDSLIAQLTYTTHYSPDQTVIVEPAQAPIIFSPSVLDPDRSNNINGLLQEASLPKRRHSF